MDDIDLYEDLDLDSKNVSFNDRANNQSIKENEGANLNDIAILQDSHDRLQKEKELIAAELVQVKEQLAQMTRVNKILKSNISSLYKTAKSEIQRKNDRITQLTRDFDNLIFRRRNSAKEKQEDTQSSSSSSRLS